MNEKTSNQTGCNSVVIAIKVIAVLAFIAGIICLLAAIDNNEDLLLISLLCVIECPFIWGFAYLVEAACKYLGKLEKKEEQPLKVSESNVASVKSNVKTFIEDYMIKQGI